MKESLGMAKAYSELVEQAERAVAAVKDAELRRVAFERVLNDLLGQDEAPGRTDPAPERKRRTRPVKPGSAERVARKRGGPQAYVEEMAGEGFFRKPKTISEVKAELENRGHHIPLTSLSGPMQKLCQKKTLRRQRPDGKTFSYSNW
jgi:hypothetical protein